MAFAHHLLTRPPKISILPSSSSSSSSSSPSIFSLPLSSSSSPLCSKTSKLSIFPGLLKLGHRVPECGQMENLDGVTSGLLAKSKPQDSEVNLAAEAFTSFKHLLLPVTDRNPYLSEGTRQATATTAALAKKYGADITVVVIDEKQKESIPEHDTQLSSIRWHLSEVDKMVSFGGGLCLQLLWAKASTMSCTEELKAQEPSRCALCGFQEFRVLERLGEGSSKPTAIIGEVADDLNLDLVVLSMEAIHSKHVDANLLAEFIPCPVLLLPL
ncbi:hypothetical protein CK203_005947 [Vitis vinifera]|uniref:Uncharacterized protein n=1 Tax=Vitis vinifera TaxID=29760 RepID=A0A438K616_VITVI|nr:hypothetical protein CK203_005947 [Vitis vinifera]